MVIINNFCTWTMNYLKKQLRKVIPFTITMKEKCWGINLTKEAKDLHTENHKTWWKKLKET
jgi:hypothetical protein